YTENSIRFHEQLDPDNKSGVKEISYQSNLHTFPSPKVLNSTLLDEMEKEHYQNFSCLDERNINSQFSYTPCQYNSLNQTEDSNPINIQSDY
ncbi:MAG: hypothetical protein MHPSP_004253, partial [Paramarteilia canceri]